MAIEWKWDMLKPNNDNAATIEALRAIAEQLEMLNKTAESIMERMPCDS